MTQRSQGGDGAHILVIMMICKGIENTRYSEKVVPSVDYGVKE